MHDTVGLRALITEYDRLRSRKGGTLSPQNRGTQLNEYIAGMLRVWGIDARASTLTPAGEIDVSFSLNGQRFIAEAKREQAKTDVAPLAKLALRLAQRMRGTLGIFISMAGYTSDALADLVSSGERWIPLLDRHHLEAMISGTVSPTRPCLSGRSWPHSPAGSCSAAHTTNVINKWVSKGRVCPQSAVTMRTKRSHIGEDEPVSLGTAKCGRGPTATDNAVYVLIDNTATSSTSALGNTSPAMCRDGSRAW